MFAEQEAIIERDIWPAGVADGQQPPTAPQGAQRLGKRRLAHIIHDHVDTAPAGEPVHLAPPIDLIAVDSDVGAQLLGQSQLLRR